MFQSQAKTIIRRARAKALLERQSRREKAGFYDGQTSLATAMSAVGRLMRVKIDDTGKRRKRNLRGWA